MAATDLERLVVSFEARFDKLQKGVDRAVTVFDRGSRRIEKRQSDLVKRLKSGGIDITSALTRPLAAVGAALSARQIIQYGDAWTVAGNKIAAAGTPLDEVATRLRELNDLAVNTRTAFDPTVTLFSRLDRSTKNLGLSQKELLRYTETINKAFIVGGAAASEQTAGILQLTQAISSGLLQGDELRSVRENASVIAQAIADVMGVTIGELKDLGAEGKITVDVILRALDKVAPAVDTAFSKTQLTVSQALGNLESRFMQFVGGLSESGALAALASGIDLIAENLDKLGDAAIIASAALAPAGLALAARGAAAGLDLAITGMLGLTSAILANPLGALAVVLSAAAAAAYLYYRDTQQLTDAQRQANDAHRVALDLEKQVKDGRVTLARATAEKAIADAEASLEAKKLNAETLRTLALEAELSRQRQRNRIGEISQQTQRDARLNELASLEAEIAKGQADLASLRKNLPQTGLGGVVGGGGGGGGKSKKEKAPKIDPVRFDLLQETESAVQGLKDEAAQLGLTAVAADTLRFKQGLLNAATQEGIAITPELAAEIENAAAHYGTVAARIAETTQALQNQIDITDAARDGLVDIGTASLQGFGAMRDAASRALQQIAEMILQLYVLKPLVEGLLGASGTSGGGAFGAVLSGVVGSFGGAFAKGGYGQPNKTILVGEKGPELLNTGRSGATITPLDAGGVNRSARAATRGAASPSADGGTTAIFNIDATGADAAGLARVEQAINALNRNFDARAVNAVIRTRAKGGATARRVG